MHRPAVLIAAAAVLLALAAGCGRGRPAVRHAPRRSTSPAAAAHDSALASLRGTFRVLDHEEWLRECGAARARRLTDRTGGLLVALYRELAGRPGDSIYVVLRGRREGPGVTAIEVRRAAPGDPRRACAEDLGRLVLRARGEEPFWAIEITAAAIVFEQPDEPARLRFAAAAPRDSGGARIWTARAGGHRIVVAVRDAPCRDAMSGEYTVLVAEVELDGRRLAGCAREGALYGR